VIRDVIIRNAEGKARVGFDLCSEGLTFPPDAGVVGLEKKRGELLERRG